MHESKGYIKIKTGVGANKNNEIKGVRQFTIELNDPHGPQHCLGAHGAAFILDIILRYSKHISDFL